MDRSKNIWDFGVFPQNLIWPWRCNGSKRPCPSWYAAEKTGSPWAWFVWTITIPQRPEMWLTQAKFWRKRWCNIKARKHGQIVGWLLCVPVQSHADSLWKNLFDDVLGWEHQHGWNEEPQPCFAHNWCFNVRGQAVILTKFTIIWQLGMLTAAVHNMRCMLTVSRSCRTWQSLSYQS